jgi:LysR family transcriptional regulator for bpeEF and oprC
MTDGIVRVRYHLLRGDARNKALRSERVERRMDKLDTIRMFMRVVETTSFSKAAKAQRVVQSTVSKQIAALESRLGAELLRRTSRGMSLTEAGRTYFDSVSPLVAELDTVESQVGGGLVSPSGRIRVAMSAGLGRMFVVPRLAEFFALYPSLTVDLDISERYINLVEDGIDAAIRTGNLPDSALLARRMGSVEIATFAAPAYLERRGEPKKLTGLERHDCVTFMFHGNPRPWLFATPNGPLTVTPDGPVRTNDAEHGRVAVLSGLGIAHSASWLFADDLASGAVKRVLTPFTPPTVPIHIVSPGGRGISGKVRALTDFLKGIFDNDPHLRIR